MLEKFKSKQVNGFFRIGVLADVKLSWKFLQTIKDAEVFALGERSIETMKKLVAAFNMNTKTVEQLINLLGRKGKNFSNFILKI